MYAEDKRLDEALQLATIARDAMRQRPEPEDTLGWVYHLKQLPVHAVSAFERAIARSPDNPVYHYHLGLAQSMAGNPDRARKALSRALELKSDFNGADAARKALAEIQASSGRGSSE
jgi:tetratricopeptide (TPR) repeat protein